MSNVFDAIQNDLKDAMRARDELGLLVLRMLIAAVKNKRIELNKKDDLSDDEVLAVIKSEVKKRKDSISSYEAGGRQDLVDKEKAEIKIIEKYMPEMMSEEEICGIVKEVVGSMGEVTPGDFGKVMGAVMGRVKGKADGIQVSAAVKKVLE